jgi:hypothetical protein
MGIKIEGDGVKVLGGGTQAYNKNADDRRRPLIMKSPHERQKAVKRAKDPIYKSLLQEIEDYKADISNYEDIIEVLETAHAEELEIRNNIIMDLDAKLKEFNAVKAVDKPATKSKPKDTKAGD